MTGKTGPAYSASKAGVVGLTLPVVRDLMDEGTRVKLTPSLSWRRRTSPHPPLKRRRDSAARR
jgi:hypothetical protein